VSPAMIAIDILEAGHVLKIIRSSSSSRKRNVFVREFV
jgi:hypothetical protein